METVWRNFVTTLTFCAALLVFVLGSSDPVKIRVWPAGAVEISTFWLLAAGFLAGALVTVVLFWLRERGPERSWIYVALFCAVVMAVAAARTEHASLLQSLLVILFGSVALIAAAHALSRFEKGERIELQSNWGGLGGGLGGWQLSSVTSLVLIALIFAGGATISARSVTGRKAEKQETKAETQESKVAKDSKTDKSPQTSKQPEKK